jgi:hypothetical protein
MAFVINALAIADQEDLGRFVVDPEEVGDAIRDWPVIEQVKIIKVNRLRFFGSFQPAFNYGARRAAGTVFKDKLGTVGRSGFDVFELGLGL